MKFLHTADLHIGLRLCEYSMIADVRHILKEIAEIAVREQCGAVIAAGDIYDRSVPSAEALRTPPLPTSAQLLSKKHLTAQA